jgi:hypothetical protein
MADTMTLRTEPVRLTRANLTGITFRIGKVYGTSPLGVRVYLMYHASKGCNDLLMSKVLARCIVENIPPMANVHGESCSRSYYARLTLSGRERERRECEARKLRVIEEYERNERRAS